VRESPESPDPFGLRLFPSGAARGADVKLGFDAALVSIRVEALRVSLPDRPVCVTLSSCVSTAGVTRQSTGLVTEMHGSTEFGLFALGGGRRPSSGELLRATRSSVRDRCGSESRLVLLIRSDVPIRRTVGSAEPMALSFRTRSARR